MTGSGASIAAALFLAASSLLASTPARAEPGEHRLTALEIRDLARRELLWCDGYQSVTDDCEQITLMQLTPDGGLSQTTTLLLETSPLLEAYLAELDRFEGDRLCSKIDSRDMPAGFLLEGKPVPEPTASALRSALLESLVDLHGKTVCQSFYRGSDPNRIREEITVNGERRRDLESSYVLRDGARGFALRGGPPEQPKGTKI